MEAALRALEAAGKSTGVHRLRAQLGHRGNPSTIARLRAQVLARRAAEAAAGARPPLPQPVLEAADRVWLELLDAVETYEEQVSRDATVRVDEAEERLTAALRDRDALRADLEGERAARRAAETTLAQLDQALQGERLAREKAEGQARAAAAAAGAAETKAREYREQLATQAQAQQETMRDLRDEHRAMRGKLQDALDAARTAAAQREGELKEVTGERDRLRTALASIQGDLHGARDAAARAEARAESLQAVQRRVQELEELRTTLQAQVTQLTAERDHARGRGDELAASLTGLRDEHDALVELVKALSKERGGSGNGQETS